MLSIPTKSRDLTIQARPAEEKKKKKEKEMGAVLFKKEHKSIIFPVGDSNPCRRSENAVY